MDQANVPNVKITWGEFKDLFYFYKYHKDIPEPNEKYLPDREQFYYTEPPVETILDFSSSSSSSKDSWTQSSSQSGWTEIEITVPWAEFKHLYYLATGRVISQVSSSSSSHSSSSGSNILTDMSWKEFKRLFYFQKYHCEQFYCPAPPVEAILDFSSSSSSSKDSWTQSSSQSGGTQIEINVPWAEFKHLYYLSTGRVINIQVSSSSHSSSSSLNNPLADMSWKEFKKIFYADKYRDFL